MHLFLKGIIVGLGGVSPGLSGSVLLILFGLYQKTLDALATLPKRFRENIRFLLPLSSGMLLGVLLFGKVLDYFLNHHEVLTRFTFLGLILGTIPLFWKEVRKKGFSARYYAVILLSAIVGTFLFTINPNGFAQLEELNLLQSVLLGIAVAASAIIPGVDPAVLLSTLGFYEVYVAALAAVDLSVLLPMLAGLGAGAVLISAVMGFLFRQIYTLIFSVIFGVFLSMIPNMLTPRCYTGFSENAVGAVLAVLIGFLISWLLGDLPSNKQKIRLIFQKKE